MFEVPNAKRIKRSELELQDEGDNEDNITKTQADLSPQVGNEPPDYGFAYDFITPQSTATQPRDQQPDNVTDSRYEFRLFSTHQERPSADKHPSATDLPTITNTTQVITLERSPSPTAALPEQEGRLLRPRPASHYFTTTDSSLKAQYATTALTATTLATLYHTSWPGTSLPWRVIHIPSRQLHKSLRSANPLRSSTIQEQRARRPKPSKKRRILVRQRLAARLKAQLASQPKPKPIKVVNEKGELELDLAPEEREKRTARNREKKLKRRQRERDRKAGLASDIPGEGDVAETQMG